jgi:hypothetical protein
MASIRARFMHADFPRNGAVAVQNTVDKRTTKDKNGKTKGKRKLLVSYGKSI